LTQVERKGLKVQVRTLLHGKTLSVTDSPTSIGNRPTPHCPLLHNPATESNPKNEKGFHQMQFLPLIT